MAGGQLAKQRLAEKLKKKLRAAAPIPGSTVYIDLYVLPTYYNIIHRYILICRYYGHIDFSDNEKKIELHDEGFLLCFGLMHISSVLHFPRKKGKNMKFPPEKGKKPGKICH